MPTRRKHLNTSSEPSDTFNPFRVYCGWSSKWTIVVMHKNTWEGVEVSPIKTIMMSEYKQTRNSLSPRGSFLKGSLTPNSTIDLAAEKEAFNFKYERLPPISCQNWYGFSRFKESWCLGRRRKEEERGIIFVEDQLRSFQATRHEMLHLICKQRFSNVRNLAPF